MERDVKNVKKEILEVLEQSVGLLNEIPVTDIRDCRRKVLICDGILGARKLISALEITEKEKEHDDTQAAD